MHTPSHFLLLTIFSLIKVAVSEEGICSMPPSIINSDSDSKPLYWKVTNPTLSPSHLQDLPGFTRSVYKRDHALITPESQVFSSLPEWTETLGAYLITPAIGSNFVMYLAKMQEKRSNLRLVYRHCSCYTVNWENLLLKKNGWSLCDSTWFLRDN